MAPIVSSAASRVPRDVQIDILFCGVCHSDLHTARNEWGRHDVSRACPATRSSAASPRSARRSTRFKRRRPRGGRLHGRFLPQLRAAAATASSSTATSGADLDLQQRRIAHRPAQATYGGYSTTIVVDEALRAAHPRERSTSPAAAPLLAPASPPTRRCVTGRRGTGKKVGIVGLGGLGHMGVKLAHAFGAHVVLFTTSPGKARRRAAARRRRGRGLQGRGRDGGSRPAASTSSSTPSPRRTTSTPTSALSKRDGTLVLVGVPPTPHPSPVQAQPAHRPAPPLAGSLIGGIAETQEMLDFCAEHGIVSDIEMIPIQQINEAYERMLQERREVPLRDRHGVADVMRVGSVSPTQCGARDRPTVGRETRARSYSTISEAAKKRAAQTVAPSSGRPRAPGNGARAATHCSRLPNNRHAPPRLPSGARDAGQRRPGSWRLRLDGALAPYAAIVPGTIG